MTRPRPDTSVVKRCSTCKETKPREEFYRQTGTFDSLQTKCKTCSLRQQDEWRRRNLKKESERQKKFRKENPRRFKDYKLKQAYKVPYGTYEILLKAQGGKCAICGTTNPGGRGDFHVDHCHDTNAIRGLLCHGCNVGIGSLQHDPKVILAAAEYLRLNRM